MSVLEKKLDELIAQQDGVRPEDVTIEYIREQRKLYKDPNHRFVSDSECSDDYTGLKTQTFVEIEAEAKKADAFMAQFRKR